MLNKWRRHIVFVTAGALLALAFNNCGKGKSPNADLASGGLDTRNVADVCNETEINVFSRGYHQFLKETCKNCHISGPGKGTFASPDINAGFSGFQMLGYDKISQYAVSENHNPPYTGSHNLEIINALRLQWQTFQRDKMACSGSSSGAVSEIFTPKYESTVQSIPQIFSHTEIVKVNNIDTKIVTFDRKTMTWDLGKQLIALTTKAVPTLIDVQLSVTVTGYQIPSGETAYLFSLPMLKVGRTSLHVKGLNFRLNGFAIGYATTFKKLELNVYQNTTALLSPGSLVSVGAPGPSDTLALQLGDIEIIDMAQPPPPPAVQFKLASFNVEPDQTGPNRPVTVEVEVVGDNPEAISVGVNVASSTSYAAGETPASYIVGVGQNRFDWDYKFDPATSTSLNFKSFQKTASFNLIFSNDERFDVDKVIRLEIGTPFGAVLGTNKVLRITLPNRNPPYSGVAPTFSLMMNPNSGIMGTRCVKCHNSVQKQGGYDMTDYQEMVTKGVIVPGDPTLMNHKMYRRTNADAPNLEGLQSMPLDGFLPASEVRYINDWLKAGARNN